MNDFWSEAQRVFVGENLTDETAGVETSIHQTWPWPPWVLLALLLAVLILLRPRAARGTTTSIASWKT